MSLVSENIYSSKGATANVSGVSGLILALDVIVLKYTLHMSCFNVVMLRICVL